MFKLFKKKQPQQPKESKQRWWSVRIDRYLKPIYYFRTTNKEEALNEEQIARFPECVIYVHEFVGDKCVQEYKFHPEMEYAPEPDRGPRLSAHEYADKILREYGITKYETYKLKPKYKKPTDADFVLDCSEMYVAHEELDYTIR